MARARHYQTTVTTSATVIEGTQYPYYILHNFGADTVFLGGDSGVTTGTGFPVPTGGTFSPHEKAHEGLRGLVEDRLWGIAAASRDIRVIVPTKNLDV
jgi:hypothetical protein